MAIKCVHNIHITKELSHFIVLSAPPGYFLMSRTKNGCNCTVKQAASVAAFILQQVQVSHVTCAVSSYRSVTHTVTASSYTALSRTVTASSYTALSRTVAASSYTALPRTVTVRSYRSVTHTVAVSS